MTRLIENQNACGEVFNIGSDKEISIYELARMIREMTKSKSEIVYVPYEQAYEEGFEDMRRRLPDISKIARIIGYKPSLQLRGILEKIINYEKDRAAKNYGA